MNRLKNKALQDDLIRCVSLMGVSFMTLSHNPNFEPWHRTLAIVTLVLLFAMCFLEIWMIWRNKRMTPEEKREAEREKSDERSQMIQDRAMRNCWSLEDALLVIALIVFLVRNQPAVYSVLYLVMTLRVVACVAIRWWLERKY